MATTSRDDNSGQPPTPQVVVQQTWSELGPNVAVTASLPSIAPTDQNHVVEVTTPTARELADLVGIILDLEFVLEGVRRLAVIDKPPQDVLIAQALWNAVLVAYARCFVGGRRQELSTSLFESLKPGAAQAHQHIMDMRDKHVAHSVNPFDQVRVGAVLSPKSGTRHEVKGTAHFRHQLVGWDQKGLETFEYLASEAHAFAMRQFKDTETKLFDELCSMPIDDLYRQPDLRIITPNPDLARQTRR